MLWHRQKKTLEYWSGHDTLLRPTHDCVKNCENTTYYIFLQSKNAVIASIGVSCVKAIAVTTKREGSLSYKEKGLFELLLSKWRVLPPHLFLSWLTQNWWSVMVQQRSSIQPVHTGQLIFFLNFIAKKHCMKNSDRFIFTK